MFRKVLFLFLAPLIPLFAGPTDFIQEAIKGLLEEFMNENNDVEETLVRTSHEIDIPSGKLRYSAITGTLPQYTDTGETAGELFFTAYLKEEHDPNRPITFIFNGGPGGSSLSMHIAGFGPRRLLYPEEGQGTLPPFEIVDNQETLLDLTDIILVDPIGTGYSRAEDPAYKDFYYSVEGDILSFAEFIRVFCVHFDRWNSPKYLIGASYGTCRACGLAEALIGTSGIYLNGVALLGSVLDLNNEFFQRDNFMPECLLLPTYAATAWYHGRSKQDLPLKEVVEYARRFALDDYAPAMSQPTRLSQSQREAFYQELADLIGLPLDTIRRYRGRIPEHIYVSEFKAAERKLIGGIDSRYEGDISALVGEYNEDPSYRNFRPAFFPAFMQYMQTELDTSSLASKYKGFSSEAFYRWDWWTYDTFTNIPTRPNFLQRLRRTLVAHPAMKVFVGSGYYDIRTPFMTAEYSIDHLELPESYRKNFQFEYYEAGHGFIFDLPSLQKMRQDLRRFYGR